MASFLSSRYSLSQVFCVSLFFIFNRRSIIYTSFCKSSWVSTR